MEKRKGRPVGRGNEGSIVAKVKRLIGGKREEEK